MKKLIIVTIIVPCFHFSQTKTELEIFGNSRGSVFDVTNPISNSYAGIEGSPYLDEKFRSLTIDGYSKQLPQIRYNAYEDEMEFKLGDKLNYIIKQNNLKFKLAETGKVYLLTRYHYDNADINGYLVEIVGKGRYTLYKREKIQIVEYNNNTTNTYLKNKNPYFEREKDIYLINDNGNFRKLPKNLKELIQLLGIENSKPILDYSKENHLNLKTEVDLIKLFNFINSLK